MRLVSADGATFVIRPVRYQFPGKSVVGRYDWDANWLVVEGDVHLPDGRGWSFSDPCLTTGEAISLGAWLRGVVAGAVQCADFDGEDEALECYTEPTVAFSLAARHAESAVVRAHLSLAARPPWLGRDVDVFDFFVPLDVPLDMLSAAADDWERELAPFPPR